MYYCAVCTVSVVQESDKEGDTGTRKESEEDKVVEKVGMGEINRISVHIYLLKKDMIYNTVIE